MSIYCYLLNEFTDSDVTRGPAAASFTGSYSGSRVRTQNTRKSAQQQTSPPSPKVAHSEETGKQSLLSIAERAIAKKCSLKEII
jgi:hypothetical protein